MNVSYSYDNDSRVSGITYNFGANLLGNLTYTSIRLAGARKLEAALPERVFLQP